VKDNISLIAAATGGFMLSIALSVLLKGTPISNWEQASVGVTRNAPPISQLTSW